MVRELWIDPRVDRDPSRTGVGMTWTLRYAIVVLAVVAVTLLLFSFLPSDPSQCIYLDYYGIGAGKVTSPLPCDWSGYPFTS